MKTFLSIIIFIFFTISAKSQIYYGFDEANELSSSWDFYSVNYLNGPSSGKGNTGAASVNSEIRSVEINPASFKVNKKFEFCFQTNYKLNINFEDGYYTDHLLNYSPAIFAGIGYKITPNFQAGILYSIPNSFKNITGVYGSLTRVMTVQKIGIPLSLSLDKVNLGICFEYSFYKTTITGLTQPESPEGTYVKAEQFNFRVGLIYKALKNLSFGAAATPGVTLNPHSTLPHISLGVYPDPYFPWRLTGGVEYTFIQIPLKLAFDYNFIGSGDGLNGRYAAHNINFGGEYNIKKISLRAGFFTLNENDYYNSAKQFFITLGIGTVINNFKIDAAVLHSHFIRGNETNTIIQTSLSYGF